MDKQLEKVKEFHSCFGHPVAEMPRKISKKRVQKRAKWMAEEIDEFVEANDLHEQVDAMIDLIYFALGSLVEMGVKAEPFFDLVHDANMSKLGEDNKPIFNEEGKTIKPKGWVSPDEKIRLLLNEIAGKNE